MSTVFYAYVHAKPDGRVFYVGKGKGKRSHELKSRGVYHQRVIDKVGAENVLIGKLACSSEQIAFDLEKGLIRCFRRMGTSLTNATDGGEGTSGYKHTKETVSLLAEMASGPNNYFYGKKRPDHADKLRGRKRPDASERLRRQAKEKGPVKAFTGRKHSEESLALMVIRAAERNQSEKSSLMWKGKSKPDSQKAKMAKAATGHVWLNKDGKRTHCSPEKAETLILKGWKRGQK